MAQGIALNKINDPDKVLPKPKWPVRDSGVPSSLAFNTEGFNKAIDQYNQVMIDGDVGELAMLIYDNCSLNKLYSMEIANLIIYNLDKFLVLKKG